jgi:hypothetical protein
MTLHHSVRHLLDTRAADVAKDIDHTEACLRRIGEELDRTLAVLHNLRAEERAIADARRLLAELSIQEEIDAATDHT